MSEQTANEIYGKAIKSISLAKQYRDGMHIGIEALQLIRNNPSTPDHIRDIAVKALSRIAGSQSVDNK